MAIGYELSTGGFRGPGYAAGRAGRPAGKLPGWPISSGVGWLAPWPAGWLAARRCPPGPPGYLAAWLVLPGWCRLALAAGWCRLGGAGWCSLVSAAGWRAAWLAAWPGLLAEHGLSTAVGDGLGRVGPPVAPGSSVEGGDGSACCDTGAFPGPLGDRQDQRAAQGGGLLTTEDLLGPEERTLPQFHNGAVALVAKPIVLPRLEPLPAHGVPVDRRSNRRPEGVVVVGVLITRRQRNTCCKEVHAKMSGPRQGQPAAPIAMLTCGGPLLGFRSVSLGAHRCVVSEAATGVRCLQNKRRTASRTFF